MRSKMVSGDCLDLFFVLEAKKKKDITKRRK